MTEQGVDRRRERERERDLLSCPAGITGMPHQDSKILIVLVKNTKLILLQKQFLNALS
jgi:hypothetical protein